jgi:hypothetical protein
MCRGLGKLQRFWIKVAASDESVSKPWTFDELCRSAFPEAYEPSMEMRPSFKRSLRRALKKLVDDQNIIPLGAGGPSNPYRYCINPMLLPADRRGEILPHLEPYGFYMGADGQLTLRHHHC